MPGQTVRTRPTASTCTPRSRCGCRPGRFPADQFPERDEKNPDRVVLNGAIRQNNGDEHGAGREHARSAPLQRGVPARLPVHDGTGNNGLKKRELTAIVGELVERYSRAEVADEPRQPQGPRLRVLDACRPHDLDRRRQDARSPRRALLEHFEAEADKIEQQYDRGIITDDERRQKEIEIWTDATDQVREAMEKEMSSEQFNPIDMMVGSGARGNIVQVRQIAGMRGLVANPRGEIIPRPIKSSFREGLSVLEYFISTHGARKGLADTALRTADSGLPDPSTRRRRAGAHRARRGLRHHARHLGRGPHPRRRHPPARHPAARPLPPRGREARRRLGDAPRHRDPRGARRSAHPRRQSN